MTAVRSAEPVASRLPSRVNCRHQTVLVCPRSVSSGLGRPFSPAWGFGLGGLVVAEGVSRRGSRAPTSSAYFVIAGLLGVGVDSPRRKLTGGVWAVKAHRPPLPEERENPLLGVPFFSVPPALSPA